jgi:DNA-directed RNA polymerase specialized sigma subunit
MKKFTKLIYPDNNGIERIAQTASWEAACISSIDGEVEEDGTFTSEKENEPGFTIEGICKLTILTEKQKVVLYKRLVEDRTYDDIGKELGTSRQNIFEMYHKAIKRLSDNQTWR